MSGKCKYVLPPGFFDGWVRPGSKCEISRYLPGVACDQPATKIWGYGSLIEVCEFHYQLDPTETEGNLYAQLTKLNEPKCKTCGATTKDHDAPGHYFGLCPVCHSHTGSLNIGRSHWQYCTEHKKKWCLGANLLSSWKYETVEEQRAEYDALNFGTFEEVESHTCECSCASSEDEFTPASDIAPVPSFAVLGPATF